MRDPERGQTQLSFTPTLWPRPFFCLGFVVYLFSPMWILPYRDSALCTIYSAPRCSHAVQGFFIHLDFKFWQRFLHLQCDSRTFKHLQQGTQSTARPSFAFKAYPSSVLLAAASARSNLETRSVESSRPTLILIKSASTSNWAVWGC